MTSASREDTGLTRGSVAQTQGLPATRFPSGICA